MPMSDYEPASGWNLPPGCFTGPWDAPDPWVGKTCRDCDHRACVDMRDGSDLWVCLADPASPVEIELDDEACEGFE